MPDTAISEIKRALEDCRINVVGGLSTGNDIWEPSVLPFSLNNSDVWGDIPLGVLEQLEELSKKIVCEK